MIMINYDPDTRVVLSGGEVNPRYALQQLPDGAAYVDALPEDDYAADQN